MFVAHHKLHSPWNGWWNKKFRQAIKWNMAEASVRLFLIQFAGNFTFGGKTFVRILFFAFVSLLFAHTRENFFISSQKQCWMESVKNWKSFFMKLSWICKVEISVRLACSWSLFYRKKFVWTLQRELPRGIACNGRRQRDCLNIKLWWDKKTLKSIYLSLTHYTLGNNCCIILLSLTWLYLHIPTPVAVPNCY